ncbi:hypothetical protein ZIOFF_047677 [Zingiber officinale]|uniref:Uncharacterized protein n=1 Tax=Zingiber officinale TaxID=94328 RepID=A0A8J5FVB5_ZINOF|nr:hypothetical protein ZIOFF_047677 [Zingiber officinale]
MFCVQNTCFLCQNPLAESFFSRKLSLCPNLNSSRTPLLPLSTVAVNAISIPSRNLAMKRGKSKTDTPKKANTKLLVKKGLERAAKKPRKSKASKDPNTHKRP